MTKAEQFWVFVCLIGLGSGFYLVGSAWTTWNRETNELPGLVAAERERLRPTPEFSSQGEASKACLEHIKSLPSDSEYYCDVVDTATSLGSDLSSYPQFLKKTTGEPWHIYEEYGTVYSDSPFRDRYFPEREFIFSK